MVAAPGLYPPQYWDEGVGAIELHLCQARIVRIGPGGSAENSYFLGLNSGLNLGLAVARLLTWNANSGDQNSDGDWQHIGTYLERDVWSFAGEN